MRVLGKRCGLTRSSRVAWPSATIRRWPNIKPLVSDDSRVFFTDDVRLTENSHADSKEGDEAGDLYMCEMVEMANKLTCDLTDVTPEGSGGEPADLMNIVPGASEDGSYVYFVAKGILAAGASASSPNLYMAHLMEGKWATTFIATLGEGDRPDWGQGFSLTAMTSRVSPNGEFLEFMSSRSLTGYDTRDAVSGQPDEEVYLYSALSKKLVCASCDPTGARPVGTEYRNLEFSNFGLAGGESGWGASNWLAANVPGWTPMGQDVALYQSRYLSNSGRLFFNSGDALVPQDVNGTEDVYEYEPPGVGDCTTSSQDYGVGSEGCVGLISGGSSPEESAFLDASEDGGNVFFLTTEKLLSQDFDSSLDIYDARECSAASPCLPSVPSVPPPCSTGDACKAAPSSQPAIYGAPSSETFTGAGNIPAGSVRSVSSKAKQPTRAQLLGRALRACAKKKARARRVTCESRAKRAYGARSKAKKTDRGGK